MRIRAALLAWLAACGFAFAADEAPTPPRLAFIDGPVSFLRAGAPDWSPARINTPLAAGDRLYAGTNANLEIQIGARAFVRAAGGTELAIVSLEPDFLQFELKGGHASLDLRSLAAGETVELDTPNAVFTIEHTGYYRAFVDATKTEFITRRAGRATVSVDGGAASVVLPSEDIVVSGGASPSVATYAAPELDAWDRWNYARTDYEIEALSARYVSPGIYGTGALDHYGAWRVVPEYGTVWVPEGIAPTWAPYTTGFWISDPYYGWAWVDDAPWGWAPFHYGRWVFINGYWAWAPGPLMLQPVYAPALVAFLGVAPGVSVRIAIGDPGVRWVALGWGEPLHPWWGRPGFVGAPWWGGWAGPRVAHVAPIVYANTHARHAVVIGDPRFLSAGHVRGTAPHPPPGIASRSVLATRPPREAHAGAAPRIIAPPQRPETHAALPRPSFGVGRERGRPPQAPRYEDFRRAPGAAAGATSGPRRDSRALPGKPANQVQPGHATRSPGHGSGGGHSGPR